MDTYITYMYMWCSKYRNLCFVNYYSPIYYYKWDTNPCQSVHLYDWWWWSPPPTTPHPQNTLQWALWQQYGCLQPLNLKQYVGQSDLQRSTGSRLITTLCHTSSLSRAKMQRVCVDWCPSARGLWDTEPLKVYKEERGVRMELTSSNFHERLATCVRVCVCVCVCVCLWRDHTKWDKRDWYAASKDGIHPATTCTPLWVTKLCYHNNVQSKWCTLNNASLSCGVQINKLIWWYDNSYQHSTHTHTHTPFGGRWGGGLACHMYITCNSMQLHVLLTY